MTENKESICEDVVQCLFFDSTLNGNQSWIELCDKLNRTIQSFSSTYIWHKDEFKIYLPVQDNGSDIPMHLVSTTQFGDNIEDEWYIVYLVLELSKLYENLVIQIKDNDGEFLLIEAADSLPSWANPGNTENRVWIYQNKVHFINSEIIDTSEEITVKNALKHVVNSCINTVAPKIQQAILKRIGNQTVKSQENIHTAVVKLPLDLATLLTLKPALISPLVTTYCNHDIIDAKSFKNTKFEDCISVEVKFTRCLYAMLMHSKKVKNNKHAILNQNDKQQTLGIKLYCGYKVIMLALSNIFETKTYDKFLKKLTETGYFNGNIEGSEMYKQLLEKAKDFYMNIECPTNSFVQNNIIQLMNTKEFIGLRDTFRNKLVDEKELRDDSDDWLNINPKQLNEFLMSNYGKRIKFAKDDTITPETVTTELSSFLQKTSDFEGLELHETDDNTIEFDADEFIESVQNMLHIITKHNDIERKSDFDSDIDDEDDLDREVLSKLHMEGNCNMKHDEKVMFNMVQSLKEEKGSTGPSSTLLNAIGINKTELLDSDDD